MAYLHKISVCKQVGDSSGDETVVNSGKIFGHVDMGSGEDTFISKGGMVTGPIWGGGGNDLYVLDNAKLQIDETTGAGNDTVKASSLIRSVPGSKICC